MKKLLLVPCALLAIAGCTPSSDPVVVGTGGAKGSSGGATGTGGTTPTGTGGSEPTGTGGGPAETGGTTGSGGAGESGGANGTGGMMMGSGGRSGGGMTGSTGGRVGTGGMMMGTGGMMMGTGGMMMGTGGAPVGGAGGIPLDVAKPLNGFMFTGLCLRDSQVAVCATSNQNCPPANSDRALSGVLTTDKTVTLGGTSGTMYTITLHVQGEVESKQYGGMDQNSTAQSPKADGFCIGGTPTQADAYNVYMIRVTNPGGTAKTDYFLNSLQGPGVSNHTTYGIDYTAKIKAQGGATIRLVAADSNCSMIKNCGPTQNSGDVCAMPLVIPVDPEAKTLNPNFKFDTPYNGQWIVMTVKDVTSP